MAAVSILRHRAAQDIDRPRVSPARHRRLSTSIASRSNAFFPTEALRTQIKQPLRVTETADKFDMLATVAGGGVGGQAGAMRLGIARALVEYNVELRKRLKKDGLLTRDARIKERKKYGRRARASASSSASGKRPRGVGPASCF